MAITDIDRLTIYRRTDDAGLLPLGSPSTALPSNSTGNSSAGIGFTFTFDGVDYTTVTISARGFIRLAGTVTSATNSNLFASSADVVIAPWWDAIETAVGSGYVAYETQGTAPWRRFVVEWYANLSDTYDGTDYVRAKFQAVLYESWNSIDFRYGARETGGSPANAGSASMGIKGVTSVTTDNYRDVASPSGVDVDDTTLGGSKTTSTTGLRHYNATEWPTWAVVIEPAWPMVDHYIDVDDDELTGIQHPYGDPMRAIASNCNWLYCRHTPPAVNASPWAPANASPNDPIYVLPITPSVDGLTYQVWVETYQASGSPVLRVGESTATDPQPATDGDWSTLALPTSPAGTGDQSWTVFEIVPDPAATLLRFKFTSATNLRMTSVNVAPKRLDDFDPTATVASGWQPMSIAQIRRQGAAIHPEFFNRAWRNVARTVTTRSGALWSFAGAHVASTDYDLETTDYATRTLGVSAASIRGWTGQTVDVKVYAYDDDDVGRLTLGERGGTTVSVDVESNADEYRLASTTLALVSDEPVLSLHLTPMTKSLVGAVVALWTPPITDEDYILGTTPAPRLEYLAALVQRIRRAALYSYPMTGLATYLRRATSDEVRVAWMVGPGVKALRPRVARHAGSTKGTALDTTLYGASSGSTAADQIVIVNPYPEDRDSYPPDGGPVTIVSGSLLYDAAPAAAGDRLLESPTAALYTGGVREMVKATYGVGITLTPIPDDPSSV